MITAYEMALALAKANKHPDPAGYATAVERASEGLDPWPVEEERADTDPAVADNAPAPGDGLPSALTPL